jgi:hypothetical protein
MGKRRNADKTEQPVRKLTSMEMRQILKLHDKPYTPREISQELGVPVETVRHVLRDMYPVDLVDLIYV